MALILVTGASGRLGKLLVSALLSHGELVRAVVRPQSTASLPAGVQRYQWDLSSGPLPPDAFRDVSKAVHLAGLVGDHPYGELVRQNAYTAKNLLANCPSSVQKVIMASSVSVYGEYRGRLVDETFPPKTESPYGKSKLLSETFARDYCASVQIIFLRFGMIYGPAFEEGYFGVLDYLSSGRAQVLGDGQNRVPLVHERDAVEAIMLALEKQVPPCREYNIVGRETPTQLELLGLAARELGVAPPGRRMPVILAKAAAAAASYLSGLGLAKKPRLTLENVRQMSFDRAYSRERARQELGFEAKVKLEDGMKEVVKAYREKRGQE